MAASGQKEHDLGPRITVFGVGGAGGNAVRNMIEAELPGVTFVVCNTDAQALKNSPAPHRLQLGLKTTKGLGAGSRPEVGKAAAEETMNEILEVLEGSNMVFITAGMGGGTGTGAAPVVARASRELGALTIGVVTKPFHFEGTHRMRLADRGIEEMRQYVDTLIVIPNQNLFRVACNKTTFADAFKMADNVLHSGVRGVTDLMVVPGLINLDFNDIRTVMSEMGNAMMGTGEATGEKRAIEAAEAAISNPLLDDVSMKGARGVLINVTGGLDMTLFEVDEAANRIREEVDPDANIIFGSTFDEKMEGRMRVSVVATGIDGHVPHRPAAPVQTVVTPLTNRWAQTPVAPQMPLSGGIDAALNRGAHESHTSLDSHGDDGVMPPHGETAAAASSFDEAKASYAVDYAAPAVEQPTRSNVSLLKMRIPSLFGRRATQRKAAAPEVQQNTLFSKEQNSAPLHAHGAPSGMQEPTAAPLSSKAGVRAPLDENDLDIPAFLRQRS